MKLYKFPTRADRDLVHMHIAAYASDRISRQEMMTYVAGILVAYGITKLHLDGYRVRRERNIATRRGQFPVVLVEATRTAPDERCPVCNSNRGRYLAGEAPKVTFWCMGCGCIYDALLDATGPSKGVNL